MVVGIIIISSSSREETGTEKGTETGMAIAMAMERCRMLHEARPGVVRRGGGFEGCCLLGAVEAKKKKTFDTPP